ncbi:MAG: carboxypeptidase-like regulatory domain-containing protein, partial [Propionibacteriaceae bacterium]|nr:carboxypeptidase-like regulatory domain-containing protein [Propionibacteriaceae bacterium]
MLWHTGARRRLSHWLVGCLLALFSCALIATPQAWAAPQSCAIQITNQAPLDATTYLVEGTLRDGSNQPISGVTVNVLIDAALVASGPTNSAGFSIRIPRPAAGSHALSVQWVGNDLWHPSSRSQTINVPAPLTSEISLTINPTTVLPGGSFEVNGALTSRGSPIAEALIEIGLSWGGDIPAIVITGANGAFDTFLGVPAAENPPNGLSVTARFAGDGYYPATSQNVQLTLTIPEPSPTPETSPTPTESASPQPTSSASASV